jgi:hypothetical protein
VPEAEAFVDEILVTTGIRPSVLVSAVVVVEFA